VLRLWRPPLALGEWRTLGLFAATDAAELERVLASMPLRVWRTDEVTELAPHANDPVVTAWRRDLSESGRTEAEFLVTFTPSAPGGTSAKAVEQATASEAKSAAERGQQGRLIRLWVLPAERGVSSALGLWRADGATEMAAILRALPLYPYLTIETTPLTPHPSDPAAPGSRSQKRMEADHG
jgi:muconolactone delta-isomerase